MRCPRIGWLLASMLACNPEPASAPTPSDAPLQLPTAAASMSAADAPSTTASASDAALAASASAGPSATASAAAAPERPALLDAEGKLLPQTEDEPSVDSALFRHGIDLVFRAIVADDPEIARSFFFPIEAYDEVKAIEKPRVDWEKRLWKHFVRDVHGYHQKLGDDPDKAELLAFEPRTERKMWIKPNREGNRIPYWRMTRNHLKIRDARGKELELELTALISWRGEWFIVHLNGFT